MNKLNSMIAVALLAGTSAVAWGRIPPPPVNQNIGIPDTVFNFLNADVCRNCHGGNPPVGVPVNPMYNPDRHHIKVGQPIDGIPEFPPYRDADGDGVNDTTFTCLNCHKPTLDPTTGVSGIDPTFRDCLTCHKTTGQTTVHHATQRAQNGNCFQCHGGIVRGIDVPTLTGKRPNPTNPNETIPVDIPTYRTSLVTPYRSGKPNADTSITSSAGTHPGNCNFCHNTVDGSPNGTPEPFTLTDGSTVLINIFRNMDNHHGTGFFGEGKCNWCHDVFLPSASSIRVCQRCHDRLTLHNIEYDAAGDGIQPGQEQPYNGHIGNAQNCWGCHGNNGQVQSMASNGVTTATIPTLSAVNTQSIDNSTSTLLTVTGNGFTNSVDFGSRNYTFNSEIQLTDSKGVVTVIKPDLLTTNYLEATVPAGLAADTYNIQVKKVFQLSNPLGFVVKNPPTATAGFVYARYGALAVIVGKGFSDGMPMANVVGSGMSITNEKGEKATVYYWRDGMIIGRFTNFPTSVTVTNLFGSVTVPMRVY
ncbi:MAG: hypothetical protein AB1810_03650 [Pseudomonadota bacterium]